MNEKVMKSVQGNSQQQFNSSQYEDDDVVQASGVMSPKQIDESQSINQQSKIQYMLNNQVADMENNIQ